MIRYNQKVNHEQKKVLLVGGLSVVEDTIRSEPGTPTKFTNTHTERQQKQKRGKTSKEEISGGGSNIKRRREARGSC
jgi:hypothetical protein